MATALSPSSSPSPPAHRDDNIISTATLALPSTGSASRRLPPPCWSPDETVALIDAYRDKWYALRRGNLRANHWQEVADDVASRCPASPAKTAVQCRHKMEKLRKRYRTEIQKAAAHGGVRRYPSSWAHFQKMHAMEKGPNPTPPSTDDDEDDDAVKRVNDFYSFNQKGILGNEGSVSNGKAGGVRIKIPSLVSPAPPIAKPYNRYSDLGIQNPNNPNPRFSNSFSSNYGIPSSKMQRDGFEGRGEMGNGRTDEISKNSKGDGGIGDMVAAIQALGEGFMRIEKVKMDMARQVEERRMEMEMKRTEMILESQQRIVDAFAKAVSESSSNKKAKRMSTSS